MSIASDGWTAMGEATMVYSSPKIKNSALKIIQNAFVEVVCSDG